MNLIILLVTVKFGKSKWLSAAILDFRAARTAPWYDDDCRREKKNFSRRFEKFYRRTKAEIDEKLWKVQSKHQWQFFQQKLRDYWISSIDSCKGDSNALWSKLRIQMSPSLHQDSSHFSADDFAAFFTSKVDKIRASTSSAPPPVIKKQLVATPLSSFELVSVDEVAWLL